MNIRTLLILFFILEKLSAQVPNGGFENWNGVNPSAWQTTNIPIVPCSVIPDSDAYSGFLSVKGIVVANSSNQPFPPYLGIAGSGSVGFPITQAYEVVIGMYKLSLLPGDKFKAVANLYDQWGNPVGNGQTIVSSSTSSSTWEQLIIHVNYFATPANYNCAVFFTIMDSTESGSGQIGSYFLIDDLALAGTLSSGILNEDNDISVFPIPAHDELHVKNISPDKKNYYSIIDMTGKTIQGNKQFITDETIGVENLSSGIYFLCITSDDKKYMKKIAVE
jgi:hypothetical protein